MLNKVISLGLSLLSAGTTIAFTPSISRHHANSPGALYSTVSDDNADVEDGRHTSRRSFLSSSIAAALVAGATTCAPAHSNADVFDFLGCGSSSSGGVDYKAVAIDIADIIRKDPNKGPTLVRLVSY